MNGARNPETVDAIESAVTAHSSARSGAIPRRLVKMLAADRKSSQVRRVLRAVRRLLGPVVGHYLEMHAQKSYSQEGEDMILRRIFESKARGFYVDVGAHHPQRYSNTNYFYRRGWRGINIEPNPDAVRAFRAGRARDVNLQLGVSNRAGLLRYYLFDEPALNTFDEKMVKSRLANTPYKLKGVVEIPVEALGSILAKHLPAGQTIDFLTIDVEGLDLAVLQSNDWLRFRPHCVLVEALGVSLEDARDSEVFRYMTLTGYELIAKTSNTLFFRVKG